MASTCVVIAEANQELLEGIRNLIHDLFDSVVMVVDEASLVEVVGQVQPQLLIVDLSMPVSKELNVARTINSKFPELDFIVVSIHDEADAVSETVDAGAAGFVLKRCMARDLIPCITHVLAGQRYVSPDAEVPHKKPNNYDSKIESSE